MIIETIFDVFLESELAINRFRTLKHKTFPRTHGGLLKVRSENSPPFPDRRFMRLKDLQAYAEMKKSAQGR